jgi:hypothetical protein
VPAELDARQHATTRVIANGQRRDVQQLGDLIGRQKLIEPAHLKPPWSQWRSR